MPEYRTEGTAYFMVVNVNESVVEQRIYRLLEDFNCCKCEKCVGDMMAVALNNMKPAYVNSDKGVLFKKVDSTMPQNIADLDVEIIKAIQIVSSKPQH